jgi:hypothetical protein
LIRAFTAATKIQSYKRFCHLTRKKISHLANPRITQMADAAQGLFLYTKSEMKRLKTLSIVASSLTS